MGEVDKSKAYFDTAATKYEKYVKEQPDIAVLHAHLGFAYAGLGKRSAALAEGEKAVELDSTTRSLDDVIGLTNPKLNLAHIHILVGNYDTAIAQLGDVLKSPGWLSYWRLKLNPLYDPLRGYPGFQKLLKAESKGRT